eukprot:GHVR01176462.1.p1 GENE.GHVR01176462.1~~GHVR01176462.1.p1  ORF type:complete len:455 (-),score=112.83 GHVR01176462.1:355-1641(-)
MFFSGGFPFGGMPSGHGMPRGSSKKDIDNSKFYDILGVPKEATESDIKKAFRKLAIKHHPDKGGDEAKFKEITRAYEVLSDSEKRKAYDNYGEEGLEGAGGSDPTDIFDMFFGGGGRKQGGGGKKKGQDVGMPIKCTLEDIYNGVTRKIPITREVLCSVCEGEGGDKNSIVVCDGCEGRGVRIEVRRMGPMITQSQSTCPKCSGKGKMLPPNKKCQQCSGTGTTKQRKVLEVHVDKGMPNGHRITFHGEADQRPDITPGDIIVQVQELEHNVFSRKGIDLVVKKEISLLEALTGFQVVLEHLDGRKILLQNPPNHVVKPNSIHMVEDEGMPTHRNPFVKGRLFVVFAINFPDATHITPEISKKLKTALPRPPSSKHNLTEDECEIHYVQPASESDMNRAHHSSHRGEACDSDEEDGQPHGQRVQCAQQ